MGGLGLDLRNGLVGMKSGGLMELDWCARRAFCFKAGVWGICLSAKFSHGK